MADLSGTWLGTYWQQGDPTRFEVTFIQSGNTLSGPDLLLTSPTASMDNSSASLGALRVFIKAAFRDRRCI
jgi:hypothetical protein